MPLLKASRGAQYPLLASFTFNIADTMATTAGVTQAFSTAAGIYDVINLPDNALILDGDVVVETASNDTGTATIAVGDSASAARYLAATSIKTAGRTALGITGYRGLGEQIRITLANANGNATAGKVTVRVLYTLPNRINEAQPN